MKKRQTDISGFLLITIILLLVVGVFAALYTLRGDPVGEALSDDRVITMLVVFEDQKKPLSVYVLMYYPPTRRAAVFDIPGNLGMLIPRIKRVDRIDTVYNPTKITEFENEIEKLLGIDINFSVVYTMENLGKAADLLEGVELLIPIPVVIRNEDETVLIPSGVSRLDGDKAVMYIRYSSADEDQETAIFRRQRFFLGMLKRLGEQNDTMKDPVVSRIYQSFLHTDMSQRTRMRLFDEFSHIDTDRTLVQSVGGNLRQVSGKWLLIPSYDGSLVKEIARQTMGGLTRQNEGIIGERVFTVEVLNGTTVNGLAGRTAELLRGFGYDVISISNAEQTNYEKTEIIDRSGNERMVKTFADIIRCGNIHFEDFLQDDPETELTISNLEYRADFTLILGRDFNGRYVTEG